jgi:hypothetical protein
VEKLIFGGRNAAQVINGRHPNEDNRDELEGFVRSLTAAKCANATASNGMSHASQWKFIIELESKWVKEFA